MRADDQGIHPDAPRPADLRHDHRRADHPARALRLCDQHRPEAAADRGHRRRSRADRALDRHGDAALRLFRHRRGDRRPRRRRARCWRAASSPTSSRSRSISSASSSAASGRSFSSKPTPPIRPRPRTPSAHSTRSCGRRSPTRPQARSPASRRAACRSRSILHRLYNPEGITAYNIVPGLLGIILTMTTILMTALALTREVERGTIENLMAMPAKPYEIMIGKIVPYIGFGFVQVAVILVAADAPLRRADERADERAPRSSRFSSSRPTSRSATHSRPSPATRCRRCR